MGFRAWWQWMGALPWALRWFVVLMLVRPLVDNFYALKEVSPLLSPLYAVGVLTPVLIGASFFSRRFQRVPNTRFDLLFGVWGGLLAFNALVALLFQPSLEAMEVVIKLVTPVLLFFYLRHFVRSKRDLVGLGTTFLYAALFPFGMLLYERFFTAIGTQIARDDMVRYHGAYADVMSYAIYIVGGLLLAGFFFMDRERRGFSVKQALVLGAVGAVALLGLLSIHHAASWGVCAALVLLLVGLNLQPRRVPVLLFFVALLGVGTLLAGGAVRENVLKIFQTDLEVLEGEKATDRALHGRVGRWRRYTAQWQEQPLLARAFGLSLTADEVDQSMLLSGVHNDYLRILFATGVAGLVVYLLLLGAVARAGWRAGGGDRFLIWGMLAILMLYSISITPTLYAPLMYLTMAVFAYAALLEEARAPAVEARPRQARGALRRGAPLRPLPPVASPATGGLRG